MASPAHSALPQELLLDVEPRRPGGERPRSAPQGTATPALSTKRRLGWQHPGRATGPSQPSPLPEEACKAEDEGLTHAGSSRGWPRASRWRGWPPCRRLWAGGNLRTRGSGRPSGHPPPLAKGVPPLGRPAPIRTPGSGPRATRTRGGGSRSASPGGGAGSGRRQAARSGRNKGALCAGPRAWGSGRRRSRPRDRPHPAPRAVRPSVRPSVGPASRGRPAAPSGRTTPLARRQGPHLGGDPSRVSARDHRWRGRGH